VIIIARLIARVEEGQIVPFGTGSERKFVYEYNLRDRLGNNRVTFMGTALGGAVDVVQTNSYYPLGLVLKQTNVDSVSVYSKNKYLYKGDQSTFIKMIDEHN
jgi:hypothetical protein